MSAYRLGLIYFMQMEDYVLSVDAIQPSFKDRAEEQFQHIIEASLETNVPPILVAQCHAYLGLIAAAEIKFLFSIQLRGFANDLDNSNISPALHQELEKYGITLSQSAGVLIQKEGDKQMANRRSPPGILGPKGSG